VSGEVNWPSMRDIVLQRLHGTYDSLSKEDMQKPILHMQDPETMDSITLSPQDILIEVNALSEIGKKIIVAQVRLLGLLQP
jgi:hypothetical protein